MRKTMLGAGTVLLVVPLVAAAWMQERQQASRPDAPEATQQLVDAARPRAAGMSATGDQNILASTAAAHGAVRHGVAREAADLHGGLLDRDKAPRAPSRCR